MHYKALVLDLDGTIIQIKKGGLASMPSKNVINAINKASKKIKIVVATGRPYYLVKPLLSYLYRVEFLILNNGAQIINTRSKKIIIEKSIDIKISESIFQKIKDITSFRISHGIGKDLQYYKGYKPQKILNIYTEAKNTVIDKIIDILPIIPTVTYHKYHVWKKGRSGVIISNVNATKMHGVHEVAKILGIKKDEIIGVGDDYSDFSLFASCGFKIAMGNAISELKSIANYIAPPIEKDGVYHIIEKFIL